MVSQKKKKTIEENTLNAYFEEIKKIKLLTFAQELALSKRIQRGDNEALQKLITSNLRLVVKIAKEYQIPDISLLDLIQEGNVGLIRAAKKYDYRKNVRFSTHAAWWIKQAITRALTDKRRMIRLPHRKEEKLRRINKAFNYLYQLYMRKPSVEEVADYLHIDPRVVTKIVKAGNNIISFDKENTDDSLTLHDVYEDTSFAPEKSLFNKSLRQETMKVLECLLEKEKQILMYRFSFFDGRKHTLKNIGAKLGLSPETVRQIEMRAIKKLKQRAIDLKTYIYN